MYVNVAFAVSRDRRNLPVVPVAAVQNIGNRQLSLPQAILVFCDRPVRLGSDSNGYYPVLEGLSVGVDCHGRQLHAAR